MQRDAVAQSNPSAEYSASFDVFVCPIDPSNSTLIPGGRKSRGAAKATSNVEKVIFCRKTKLIEKIYSGLTATDVELINRGKVINGYRVNRFTKRSHPSTYRSSQVPMSVMLGDILRCWHRVPLEKVGAISESKGILVYRFELVTAL